MSAWLILWCWQTQYTLRTLPEAFLDLATLSDLSNNLLLYQIHKLHRYSFMHIKVWQATLHQPACEGFLGVTVTRFVHCHDSFVGASHLVIVFDSVNLQLNSFQIRIDCYVSHLVFAEAIIQETLTPTGKSSYNLVHIPLSTYITIRSDNVRDCFRSGAD